MVIRRDDRAGEPLRLRGAAGHGGDHRELVAAEAGHGGVGGHGGTQPMRDGDEEPVADLVAERVVDVLEAVEVDQQHRERHLGAGSSTGRGRANAACSPVRLARSVSGSWRAIRSRSADSLAIRSTAYSGTNTSGTNAALTWAASASTGLSSSRAAVKSVSYVGSERSGWKKTGRRRAPPGGRHPQQPVGDQPEDHRGQHRDDVAGRLGPRRRVERVRAADTSASTRPSTRPRTGTP